MYEKPIAKLKNGLVEPVGHDGEKGRRAFRILEAGFGIGFGLMKMKEAGIIERYVGYEPNKDSFDYTTSLIREHNKAVITLKNEPFHGADGLPAFDVGFCIEVIEHVPMDLQHQFLQDLRAASLLFFSTPCITKAPREGVRTSDEWVSMLKSAGWGQVTVDKSQWTYLYECRK